jgi:hypothetical protein
MHESSMGEQPIQKKSVQPTQQQARAEKWDLSLSSDEEAELSGVGDDALGSSSSDFASDSDSDNHDEKKKCGKHRYRQKQHLCSNHRFQREYGPKCTWHSQANKKERHPTTAANNTVDQAINSAISTISLQHVNLLRQQHPPRHFFLAAPPVSDSTARTSFNSHFLPESQDIVKGTASKSRSSSIATIPTTANSRASFS